MGSKERREEWREVILGGDEERRDDGGENGVRRKGDESMLVLKCVCVYFHVIM